MGHMESNTDVILWKCYGRSSPENYHHRADNRIQHRCYYMTLFLLQFWSCMGDMRFKRSSHSCPPPKRQNALLWLSHGRNGMALVLDTMQPISHPRLPHHDCLVWQLPIAIVLSWPSCWSIRRWRPGMGFVGWSFCWMPRRRLGCQDKDDCMSRTLQWTSVFRHGFKLTRIALDKHLAPNNFTALTFITMMVTKPDNEPDNKHHDRNV